MSNYNTWSVLPLPVTVPPHQTFLRFERVAVPNVGKPTKKKNNVSLNKNHSMTVINENILFDDRKRLRFIVLTAPLQYKKIKLFLKKNILFIQNVIGGGGVGNRRGRENP